MISISKKPIPSVLEGKEDEWGREYAESIKSGTSVTLRYNHNDIKNTLRDETSEKCAYCESHIEHVSFSHIEHIIPKSKKPLLVCKWDNLTLACPVCNTNKGTYFEAKAPLLNPYSDPVEDELDFYGPMVVHKSSRADLTVSKISLNRKDLMFKRYESLKKIKRLIELMNRTNKDPAIKEALKTDLEGFQSNDAEFSACAKAFIRDLSPSL